MNLMVICPNPRDATSLYRGIGPIAELKKNSPNLRISFADNVDWASLSMVDALFLQRPFTSRHVEMMELAHLNKIPVWIDYDDDLFTVTPDNPTWEVYGKESTKQNIMRCLRMADFITFSTPQLEKAMKMEFVKRLEKDKKQNFPRSMVIPNAHPTHLYDREPRKGDRNKLIVWRGSHTHVRDLLAYAEQIVYAAHRNKGWTWMFIGMYPWQIADFMPEGSVVYQKAVDPIHYMNLLHELKPDILHVPLWASEFNQSKSNIAWIEGTFAGAAVVGPDWPEWRKPGITNYKDGKLGEALDYLMKADQELKAQLVNSSWQYIESHLTLAKVNKLRVNVLKTINPQFSP